MRKDPANKETLFFVLHTFTRGEMFKLLLEDSEERTKIASAYRGNHCWCVWEDNQTKERYISLIIIKYEHANRFEKFKFDSELRESDDLKFYNCPVKYLKMAPEKSKIWRDCVQKQRKEKHDPFKEVIRQFEIAQKENKILRVHLKFRKSNNRYLLCCDYLDIEHVKPCYIQGRWKDGKLYALLPKHIDRLEIIPNNMMY